MLKFFRLPFATTGDKTAVPDAVDSNGNVSYSQGYGFDYQRQKTDPAAKNIERDKMNQIFFDMTTAIAELQSQGIPDYITSALNGGTAYSYGQYAIVKYSGALYISLVAANTALPSDATKWALLPTPALLQQSAYMSAAGAGTVDAITAAFTPAIAALPAAPGTLSVFVRATGANTSTTPTFKADGTAAKTIVKGNNVALVAGDIAGAGHWLELQYDATLDKWVLQNPASGVTTKGVQRFTTNGTFTVPAGISVIYVTASAGGGGGGGGGGTTTASGGGCGAGGTSGQSLIRQAYTVTPGQAISITVGGAGSGGVGGGAGGNGTAGTAGGNTVVGSLATLTGGGGGGAGGGSTGSIAAGGAPNATGGAQGGGGGDGGNGAVGGSGGASPFAGSGLGGRAGSGGGIAGGAASGYGSGGGGGGGAYQIAGGGNTGGNGFAGIVIIEW